VIKAVRAKRKEGRNKERNHICSICVLFLPLHLLGTKLRINSVCGTTGIFSTQYTESTLLHVQFMLQQYWEWQVLWHQLL